ncbi:aldehyde oxidoreductase [Tritrichomonas foetus]|uniref:Aldehyde oxidoreductase n=1 Tax=Tritrichomonas foetus TaxID=1144522 RepID=A0A1J4JIT2_9EUKA|nr:aldehyde oxidoreductase [Tritrichomonas foetus]|eukprot:OHS97453.1 aldehyde oxidoreductase [Tritrichomonas foetus]
METFPRFGLGTFLSEPGLTREAVRCAIEDAGYRNLDCAWVYGNEAEVGEALHDLFERKVVKREEIWVTSKLWCNAHHREDVEPQCRETLKNLQLDYLDLYLVHFPVAFQKVEGNPTPIIDGKVLVDETVSVIETWIAMQELVKKGLVKRIGVSNFNIELMEKMRFHPDITIQPYTNQVACNLYMQQEALIDYCKKRNIIVTAHTAIGRPPDTVGEPVLLEDEELVKVAN